MKKFQDGRDWFAAARFGLFVHWGLYALNGWHEQEQFRRGLPGKTTRLERQVQPAGFNPDSWLDIAESAGMRYLCFTAKHIDGFCLWDSARPVQRHEHPYGKDVFGMLAAACHRRNFPLCVYYAVPDMNCKHYPNQGRSYELPAPEPGDEPDVAKYLDFVKAQVTELCANYGKIHGFWWDANAGTMKHHDASVNRLIRALQPASSSTTAASTKATSPPRSAITTSLRRQRRWPTASRRKPANPSARKAGAIAATRTISPLAPSPEASTGTWPKAATIC